MQASNTSVIVHLGKTPLLSNIKFRCDSLRRTLKDKKKNIMSFIKKIRMCEPQISLKLRVLFEKMDLFKN